MSDALGMRLVLASLLAFGCAAGGYQAVPDEPAPSLKQRHEALAAKPEQQAAEQGRLEAEKRYEEQRRQDEAREAAETRERMRVVAGALLAGAAAYADTRAQAPQPAPVAVTPPPEFKAPPSLALPIEQSKLKCQPSSTPGVLDCTPAP